MNNCPHCGKPINGNLVPRISLEAAEADAKRFRDLHENAQSWGDTVKDEYEQLKRYAAWACGSDSGASSRTILSVISAVDFCDGEFAIPRDSHDFGRCVRLLERFPELRSELHLVGRAHPKWSPIVARWEEIERMYRGGRAGEVDRMLQEISA